MMHARVFLLAVALIPNLAFAQAGKLWSERSNAAPFAQVPDFAALAEEIVPAVVSIKVIQKESPRRGGGFPGFPFEEPHDGGQGLGSGFVISKDGLILTNNHVVENAETIEVTFTANDHSERTMTAKLVGAAPEYDVALIQTDGNANASIAHLGDSDKIKIGDWVMAVGNPFGLTHSVSVGIISAKERRGIEPSGPNGQRPTRGLYDFLQTDASINPGNSGGPLVNMRGEVIGINAAINAAGSGIGFAIPINMVKLIVPELKAKGRFASSWIGIKIQPVSVDLAKSLGIDRPTGALVAEVVPEGPAAEAGLKEGDVILEFDGKTVRSSTDLPLYASMAGVGKKVSIKYWRNKKEGSLNLKLSEYPTGDVQLASAQGEGSALGLVVADITPSLQQQFGIDDKAGVIIKQLDRKSPAERAGLQPGDIILSVNGNAIKRARDFKNEVQGAKKGDVLRMQIARQGSRIFIAMTKP